MNIHVYWYSVAALNIGHTGNVRFLTFAELITDSKQERRRSVARQSLISKLLVISGGDGYEVIDPTQQPKETVGFNDSINHLLAWKMWPLDYYRWISENKLSTFLLFLRISNTRFWNKTIRHHPWYRLFAVAEGYLLIWLNWVGGVGDVRIMLCIINLRGRTMQCLGFQQR